MFNDFISLMKLGFGIFTAIFAVLQFYFKPKKQINKGKLIIRAAYLSFTVTLLIVIIATIAMAIFRKKEPTQVIPFEEDKMSVLVLPFDLLEDSSSKQEDMARAILINLEKQIIDESFNNLEVRLVSKELPAGLNYPNTHEESRRIGKKFKADIVIWGEQFERSLPDTSRVCVNYTLTNPNELYSINSGTTGVQKATVDMIYEGKLLNDVHFIVNFLVAQYFIHNMDFQKASEYLIKAVTYVGNKDPILIDIFCSLGDLFLSQRDFLNAIDNYKKALTIDPTNNRTLSRFGIYYYWQDDFKRAEEYFNIVLECTPVSATDYYYRGMAYSFKNEYEKALDAFNQAIDQKEFFADAYASRSIVNYQLEHDEQALKDCNTAISIFPNSLYFYNFKILILTGLGKPDEALKECDKLLRLHSNEPSVYMYRSLVYSFSFRFEEALDECNKAIDLAPERVVYYITRSALYMLLDNYQKALDDCNNLIRINSEYTIALEARAYIYLKLKQYDKMIDDVHEVSKLGNDGPIISLLLAYAYAGLNRVSESANFLQEAIDKGILKENHLQEIIGDTLISPLRYEPEYRQLIEKNSYYFHLQPVQNQKQ